MTSIQPDLSVITVVLNDKVGLEKAIKSVSRQIGLSIEHIIVDGGSSDGSAQLAAKHSSLPVESKMDGGIYPAMMRGAQIATGEYLVFCNAGDALLGDIFVAQALKMLKISQSDWGFGPIIEETQRGTFSWVPADKQVTCNSILYRESFVPFPSFVIKRDFYFKVGALSSKYKIAGDFELICKSALEKLPCVFESPIAVFTAGGISYERADFAWREEIAIRKSLLESSTVQTCREWINYCVRYFRWRTGKLLDFTQRNLLPDTPSWRDKRAHQIPEEFLELLPKHF